MVREILGFRVQAFSLDLRYKRPSAEGLLMEKSKSSRCEDDLVAKQKPGHLGLSNRAKPAQAGIF